MQRPLFSFVTLLALSLTNEASAETLVDDKNSLPTSEIESEIDESAYKTQPKSSKGARAGKQVNNRPNGATAKSNQSRTSSNGQQARTSNSDSQARSSSSSSHTRASSSSSHTRASSSSSHTRASSGEASGSRSRTSSSSHSRPSSQSSRDTSRSKPTTSERSQSTRHVSPSGSRSESVSRSHASKHRTATRTSRSKRHVRIHQSSHVPPRWNTRYHRYHLNGVPRHHPRYWSAGVFYYNPPPKRDKIVYTSGSEKKVTHRPTKPSRAVDRNGDFSLGIIGGSYVSGYETGGGFGDMGLGITAEYRPLEAIGLELSTTLHDESWDDDTQRINRPTQASVNLYAFPWTRVSPYVTTGLTWNKRSVQDTFFDGLSDTTVVAEDTLFGPHAGLGIEFALGENASINFDGTYTGFLNISDNDPTLPVAVQGTMGLNVYF